MILKESTGCFDGEGAFLKFIDQMCHLLIRSMMNKLFTSKQIAELDQYTIENEPISAIDLMERASSGVADWLNVNCSERDNLYIFAGPGNNGGDALAVARMMASDGKSCHVFILDFGKALSDSATINEKRLLEQGKAAVKRIRDEGDFPKIPADALIVDGLFGSGLNRPLEGVAAKLVKHLNNSECEILSIDIPSGLFGEDNFENDLSKVISATYTLTFQFPKISFFFPEHDDILGQWEVLPIGLHPEGIRQQASTYYYLGMEQVAKLVHKRSRFSHKGTFGHALLIAGAYGKMGAAVLASKSCLRSGVGLLTTHVPHSGSPIIQVAVPEAMCSIDASDLMFTEFPDLDHFSAVGVGPGIGTKPNTQRAIKELLLARPSALVIDADAINILASQPDWLSHLPKNTILTPHPKEFERLVGETSDSYSRLMLQKEFAKRYGVIVVLKGAFTSICTPDGIVYFNTTGNPGMATAGSGDVLTGIILGLLAQRYKPVEAAMLGVYVHGLAGDLAAQEYGYEALISGDITACLGLAFQALNEV